MIVSRDHPARYREALMILAWGIHVYTVTPHGSLNPQSGLVGTRRRKCVCDNGWLVDKFKRKTGCPSCGGTTEERGKGYVLTDPYDREAKPIGNLETGTVTKTKRKPCDRCATTGVVKGERCYVCDGTGTREWAPFELRVVDDPDSVIDDQLDAMLAGIVKRDELGSFKQLEWCMGEIAKRSLHRFRAFTLVYLGDPDPHSETTRLWADEALDDLCVLMPFEIRVPSELASAWRNRDSANRKPKGRTVPTLQLARRDDEMLRRYDQEGASTTMLAEAYGLTQRGVQDALAKARDRERRAKRAS